MPIAAGLKVLEALFTAVCAIPKAQPHQGLPIVRAARRVPRARRPQVRVHCARSADTTTRCRSLPSPD